MSANRFELPEGRVATDVPVGLVFMFVGLVDLVATLVFYAIVFQFLTNLTGTGAAWSLGPNGMEPREPSRFLPNLLVALVLVYGSLWFASGLGIARSRKWGFSLGIFIGGVSILSGNGLALLGLAGAVYCVLRRNALDVDSGVALRPPGGV